jgi:hypothetical protein
MKPNNNLYEDLSEVHNICRKISETNFDSYKQDKAKMFNNIV